MDQIIKAVSDGFGEDILLLLKAARGGFLRKLLNDLENESCQVDLLLGHPNPPQIWSLVLNENLDLNAIDAERGFTILDHAILHCESEIAYAFAMELQVNVNSKSKGDLTPLHLAVSGSLHQYKDPSVRASESSKMVEMLVECNANVNAQDHNSRTPLHEAALSGYTRSVEILLQHGAHVNVHDKSHARTPLHEAAMSGNAECVQALLTGGAHAYAQDKNGNTPLHLAAREGKPSVIRCLIYSKVQISCWKGCSSNKTKNADSGGGRCSGVHPILDQKQILSDQDASKEVKIGYEKSLMADHSQEVANSGAIPRAQKFNLKMCGRVDVRNKDGESPLHLAVRKGQTDVVKVLVEVGADVEAKIMNKESQNATSATPLTMALEGHFDEIGSILLNGALSKKKFEEVEKMLHQIVDRRLEQEQDPKLKPSELAALKNSLVHKAAMLDSTFCLAFLLGKTSADKLTTENQRQTPLHIAAICQNVPAVRFLLNQQDVVDAMQEDAHGWTALDYALVEERPEREGVRAAWNSFLERRLAELGYLERSSGDEARGGQWESKIREVQSKRLEMQVLFMEKREVKKKLELFEKERQTHVEAVSAFLVGAVLMAGASFAGWLQPPMSFNINGMAYVEESAAVRVFWVANCLCFLSAVNSMLFAATALTPAHMFTRRLVNDLAISMIGTWDSFLLSVQSGLVAFATAGFASLPPSLKYMRLMIAPLCAVGLCTILILFIATTRFFILFKRVSILILLRRG